MSVSMHPTMQELADRAGVSRRPAFQAPAVNRYGCLELVKPSPKGALPVINGDLVHRRGKRKGGR